MGHTVPEVTASLRGMVKRVKSALTVAKTGLCSPVLVGTKSARNGGTGPALRTGGLAG